MASYGFVDPQIISRKKHSRLGIASFVFSLFGLIGFSLFALYIVLRPSGGTAAENSQTTFLILGIFVILAFLLMLVGIGLGIAGIIQKQRNRFFAVTGLVFNALVAMTVVLVMIYGFFH